MSPLARRRRRRILGARPRVLLVPSLVLAVVAILLLGGLLKVGSQSASYWRAVDRSYAAQARAIASQGTRLDAELSSLLGSVSTRTRSQVQATLDTLVRSSGDLARAATTAASPAPADGAGGELATAFSERSQAMVGLRTAVDRLLGMSPLPVTGSPPKSPAVTTVDDAPLSAATAVTALDQVGALLGASDRAYATARRSLRAAPGRASLPASLWASRRSGWVAASPQALVGALTSAPQLAVVHRVTLLANDVGLTPAAVPAAASPGSPSASSMVPPTHHLSITTVVADQGNVAEPGVAVSAVLQPSTAGATVSKSERAVSLVAGGSVAVTLGGLRVAPGGSYTVTVSITPPAGEAPGTPTSVSFPIAVAPPSPPSVITLSPARGSHAGGTVVTIFGTGFTSVSGVTFGHAPATRVSVVSSTRLTATAPAGSGTVAVSVTNPGGTSAASSSARFTYTGRSAAG